MYIAKKPNGHYKATVQHNGQKGTVTRPSRGEVVAAAAEMLIEFGGKLRPTEQTLELLIAEWRSQADHSKNYRDDLDRVLGWEQVEPLLERQLHTIDDRDITALYARCAKAGRSPFRITKLHGLLCGAYTYAVQHPRHWGVTANPMVAVPPPVLPPRNVRFPNAAQINQLRDAITGTTFEAYLELAAITGGRRGELVALQWDDIGTDSVNLRRNLIIRPATEVACGYIIGNTKTGEKGKGIVAVPARVIKRLQSIRRDQLKMKLSLGSTHEPLWVFSHDAGYTPWHPEETTDMFRALREQLGLPADIKLKNFRHFMATQMLGAGVPLATVSKRMRHSRQKTTEDFYTEYVPAADQDAAATIDRILRLG